MGLFKNKASSFTTNEEGCCDESAVEPNGIIIVNNTLFVMPDGNNLTGLRERLDLPYATPWAATLAATSGDTIIVSPGVYATSSSTDLIAKNGITLHLMKGAILTFTGTSTLIKPLWDQGLAITFSITGQGTINYNTTTASSSANIMSANSVYNIELDTWNGYNRLFSTNGSYFKFKANSINISGSSSFIAWRNSVSTATQVYLDCDTYNHTSSYYQILTPIDFRNFSATAILDIRIKTYKAGYSFAGFGSFYLSGILGSTTIIVNRFIENDPNVGSRPLIYWIGGAGYIDIQFNNVNHTGGLVTFVSTAVGLLTYGKVKVHGTIDSNASNGVAAVFNTGSKVEFDYDIVLTDNFTATGTIGVTNTPPTVFFTGKIRHSTSLAAATTSLFVNNNVGGIASATPTFNDLTIQSNADYILNGGGAAIADLRVLNVQSNKPVNALLFNEVIDTIIVDALVTV